MSEESSDRERVSTEEIGELVDNSDLLGEDGYGTEFEKWDETDSRECDHRYRNRSVEYLEQWDRFTKRTSAASLSVCTKCGFIPEYARQ